MKHKLSLMILFNLIFAASAWSFVTCTSEEKLLVPYQKEERYDYLMVQVVQTVHGKRLEFAWQTDPAQVFSYRQVQEKFFPDENQWVWSNDFDTELMVFGLDQGIFPGSYPGVMKGKMAGVPYQNLKLLCTRH